MRLWTLLLLFSLQNGLHSFHPDMYKDTAWAWRTMLKQVFGWDIPSHADQTIPSSTETPPSSNLLDIDVAKQPIPSPSPSDEKLPILEKENTVQEEHSESDSHTTQQPIPSPTSGNSSLSDHSENTNSTEEEGSGSTLLDSDFNAVLETKPSELLESKQTSNVEKQEEQKTEEKQEASSTEPSETPTPIPTTTSTPLNDSIFDVSETCDSDAICYVAPKDCTTNCEVIYAVSEKFKNATIYVKQGGVVHIKTSLAYKPGERRRIPNPRHTMISCFEASGNCWQGYEDGEIYENRPSGYIGYGNYPLGQTNRRQEPKHQNWWSFERLYNKGPILEVGSHRILEYRRDPHSGANFGPFHALFLRSKE
ncbi:unnamed protein product [Caenorhabditis nigoni]